MVGARTLSGALVPLVGSAPTNFNFVSGDYSRITGLKGDASTKYLDANRSNNADPQNNKHLSVYVSENFNTPGAFAGVRDETGATNMGFIVGAFTWMRNNANQDYQNGSGQHPQNLLGVTRSTSSQMTSRISGSNTVSNITSQVPLDESINIFRRNGANVFPTGARLSFYSIGESLDLALLDSRVSLFMTDISNALS